MIYTALFSLGLTVLLMILSLLFKIAGKLGLALPLIYFLLVSTILNPWAARHESLAFAILFLLIALSVIRWMFALKDAISEYRYQKHVKEDIAWQIKQARNKGIPLDSVYIDDDGTMRYSDSKNPVE